MPLISVAAREPPIEKRDLFLQRVTVQLELRDRTNDVGVDAAARIALQGLVRLQSPE